MVLRRSYALFEKDIEGNKINFVVGKLNYSFILEEDIEKGIYVKAGDYKVVHVELTSTNEIESKYAFVYRNNQDVEVGYIENSEKLSADRPEDTIQPDGVKQIYFAIHNKSTKDTRVEISVRGGLVNNNVDVESEFTKITEKASDVYEDSVLNGADPILGEGMLPVTLDDDGKVHYASLYSEWYNYSSKKWANAVILVSSPSNSNYQVGDIIQEQDIESYFVWIPRYEYKIWDLGKYTEAPKLDTVLKNTRYENSPENAFNKSRIIDIKFGSVENLPEKTTAEVGQYYTHPAFKLGNTVLKGIWVGKFETGYNQDGDNGSPITVDSVWNTEGANQNKEASNRVIVKPNVYSWKNNTVKNMFLSAYNYKRSLESHMMKNTEWGAVAYLSHSVYGAGAEININNNSSYVTGYGAAPNTDQQTYWANCDHNNCGAASPQTSTDITAPYNTPSGYLASTTGNITGVYDMSGGCHEYMAAYMEGRGESNSNNVQSGFTSEQLNKYEKYFDKYASNSNVTSYKNRILGDATGEMGPFYQYYDGDANSGKTDDGQPAAGSLRYHNSWYADYSHFVDATYPWVHRGGIYDYGVLAGQFYFYGGPGGAYTYIGSRLVLTAMNTLS